MSLQKIIMRLMLMLPENWLIKVSGGKPHAIGERTLDPQLQFIMHQGRKNPPMSDLGPEGAKQAANDALAMIAAKPEPGVVISNSTIPGDGGHQIPVRIYRPEAQNPKAPLMVYYHQGGGVIGNLDWPNVLCSFISKSAGCPVVSVDYRKAPEHKFPAGLEDCITAYEWGLRNAESLGAPSGMAAIGGDSMGGNFSAIIAQEMKRQQKPAPELQLLIYPATDIESDYPSRDLHGETFTLTTDLMNWFMQQYVPEGISLSDLRISPALESDLSGLPPAIVVTAGFDPLVDEGDAYAKRLSDAGIDVIHKRYDRLAHGFTGFTGVSKAADAACREIAEMVFTMYKKRVS